VLKLIHKIRKDFICSCSTSDENFISGIAGRRGKNRQEIILNPAIKRREIVLCQTRFIFFSEKKKKWETVTIPNAASINQYRIYSVYSSITSYRTLLSHRIKQKRVKDGIIYQLREAIGG
jgi:hypothetical protein